MHLLRYDKGLFEIALVPADAAMLAAALRLASEQSHSPEHQRLVPTFDALAGLFELCALVGCQRLGFVEGGIRQSGEAEALRAGAFREVTGLVGDSEGEGEGKGAQGSGAGSSAAS